jgi:hypothetical protein
MAGRWNVSGRWASPMQRSPKLTMTGMRTMFEYGSHLRFLTATVSRRANANRLATRPLNPGLIDGRDSPYAALPTTICGLDMRRSVWTTDCNIRTVSPQKRPIDSGVTSIQPDYGDLTFYNAGYRRNQSLRLYVRLILRGHLALTQGRSWSKSKTRAAISARTKS